MGTFGTRAIDEPAGPNACPPWRVTCDLTGHVDIVGDSRDNRSMDDDSVDNTTVERTRYIPPLRFDWLTRFYDPLIRATVREKRFKALLVRQLGVEPGYRVLDVGCGTATLTLALKRACPLAEVHGIDGDQSALAIARAKAVRAGVTIELHHAMAWDPPFEPGSFDRIVSSLMFHHLDRAAKQRTLAAMHRLLAAKGELHVADWGKPHGPIMRAAFLGVQLLDGFATTRDSVEGALPALMRDAGFSSVMETKRLRTVFGTLSLYQARRSIAEITRS